MGTVQKITLDPVARIEGHLRVDIDVVDNKVQKASSSGTSFRGIEKVLVGRDPRQAAQITQRICGVCPIPHGRASSEAFEAAASVQINSQGRLLRNIIQGANYIDSHLLAFYLLSLPDFVAGLPSAGNWPSSQNPRAWDNAAVDASKLKDSALGCLAIRQACHGVGAIVGGKVPHPAGIIPGGATARVTAEQVQDLKKLTQSIQAFVDGNYAQDIEAVIRAWPQWLQLGASGLDMLSFGAFPEEDATLLFPRGYLPVGETSLKSTDPQQITESVATASYAKADPKHPFDGTTVPDLKRADAYSFVKAARLGGRPCEVGPLARAIVAGRDVGGKGVWARHRARQQESSMLAGKMLKWIDELVAGASALPVSPEVPQAGSGAGLTEAPRGSLGHWLVIANGTIANYHVISPTTWNASPRDEAGQEGPIEKALAGLTVADPKDPVEVYRVIHSFDPCLQCAVH